MLPVDNKFPMVLGVILPMFTRPFTTEIPFKGAPAKLPLCEPDIEIPAIVFPCTLVAVVVPTLRRIASKKEFEVPVNV